MVIRYIFWRHGELCALHRRRMQNIVLGRTSIVEIDSFPLKATTILFSNIAQSNALYWNKISIFICFVFFLHPFFQRKRSLQSLWKKELNLDDKFSEQNNNFTISIYHTLRPVTLTGIYDCFSYTLLIFCDASKIHTYIPCTSNKKQKKWVQFLISAKVRLAPLKKKTDNSKNNCIVILIGVRCWTFLRQKRC